MEDGHSNGALLLRKPLGHYLCGAGPVACFAKAEEEGACGKAGKAHDGGVRHGGGAPDDDGQSEAKTRAVPVIELAGDALTEGVCEEEQRADETVLPAGDSDLRAEVRDEKPKCCCDRCS
jgi:hypothetical protein